MNTVVVTYLVYVAISAGLTMWVGHTLYKNGALFLIDVFGGNKELASAVNHLLVVGFYLLNFGFVTLSLKITDPPKTTQASVEALSTKIGAVLVVLGLLHFGNVFVFNRLRTRSRQEGRIEKAMRPQAPATFVRNDTHTPPA